MYFFVQVMSEAEAIKSTAQSLAKLDVSTSLGLLANERVCELGGRVRGGVRRGLVCISLYTLNAM